eukprot:969779-Pleurochrysis_carterae.AAC.1
MLLKKDYEQNRPGRSVEPARSWQTATVDTDEEREGGRNTRGGSETELILSEARRKREVSAFIPACVHKVLAHSSKLPRRAESVLVRHRHLVEEK